MPLSEADTKAKLIDPVLHSWCGESGVCDYQDISGFCKSATTEEIATHNYVLTSGRYVSAEELEGDGEPFEEKMARLTTRLEEQSQESAKGEAAIRRNLKEIWHGQ